MQLKKDARKENNAQAGRFVQQIGSTVYTVNLSFKEDSRETPKDKVLWLLMRELEALAQNRSSRGGGIIGGSIEFTKSANSALQKPAAYAMMALPQADWLPERGAV